MNLINKKVHFEEKCQKLKNILFFSLMTTFYNFALKVEISWAKKVVRPILETWNTSIIVYVCMFGLFVVG